MLTEVTQSGETGLQLMEIKRLRAKGHRITLLNETHFWCLAGRR